MRSYLPAFLSVAFLAVCLVPEAEGKTSPKVHPSDVEATPTAASDSTGASGVPEAGFFGGASGGGGALFKNEGPSSLPYMIGAGAVVGVAAGKAILGHGSAKTGQTQATVRGGGKTSHGRPPVARPQGRPHDPPQDPPSDQPNDPSPIVLTPEVTPSTTADAPEPGTLLLVSSAAALSLFRRGRRR